MKKQNVLWIMAIAILFFGSCEKKKGLDPFEGVQIDKVMKSAQANLATWPEEAEACNLQVFDLIGGQHIYMGSVSTITFEGSLFVKYEAIEGCLIKETHLFAGDIEDLDDNPKIGHFPVKWEDEEGIPVIIHKIDIDEIDADEYGCFDIAAHAVVWCENGEETAWAKASDQVIALKSLMDGGWSSSSWVITGLESDATGEWCSNFRYYSLSEVLVNDPIDLVYYYNGKTVFGSLTGELDGDIIRFTVESNSGEVYESYFFMGTVEELEDYGICNYPTFPYKEISPEDQDVYEHVFEFPASIILSTTSNEFSGSRWGWYISYCPGDC